MGSIFCDIDGTLTIPPKDYKYDGSFGTRFAEPHLQNIAKIKSWIDEGKEVVIWSGSGRKYAKLFCKKYSINPTAILSKPSVMIDDNPTIRPTGRIKIIDPREMLKL